MFLKTGHKQEQSLKFKLAHTLKLSRHLKMRIKVVYRTQVFCSHPWCKPKEHMIHTVARESHSAAMSIANTFLQRKGGRGENSSCNTHIWPQQQNKSCSSRSFIHSTTHPFPVQLLQIMRQSIMRKRGRDTVRLAFIKEVLHWCSCWWLTLENNRSQTANHKSHSKAEFSYLLSHSSAKSANQGQILARNF